MITMDTKGERILRTGIKAAPGAKEKTYRLFIQEIPKPKSSEGGAEIRVAIRFGVPIFVKPTDEKVQGKIERVALTDGQLTLGIRNTGNAHFLIQSILVRGIDAGGKQTFSKELSGWYLLTGARRVYAADVSQETCRDTVRVEVAVKTNSFTLDDKLDVDKTLCLP